MQCKDICTNLVGMQDLHDLDINLNVVIKGLTPKEKELLDELKEKLVKIKLDKNFKSHFFFF